MKISKDNFFKLGFWITLLFMAVIFSSNLERKTKLIYKQHGLNLAFETINLKKIKKLIQEDKLSNKEALFYRRLKGINNL